MGQYDILSDYQNYDNNFQPMQSRAAMPMPSSPRSPIPSGPSTALPWVSAGLSGAGLLSSIYGQYQQQQMAEKNYEAQMAEYKRQQDIEAEQRRRQIAQQSLENSYTAKNSVQSDENNRMAKYSNYFRQIGV